MLKERALQLDVLAIQGKLSEAQRVLGHVGIGAFVDLLARNEAPEAAAYLAAMSLELRDDLLMAAAERRRALGLPMQPIQPMPGEAG